MNNLIGYIATGLVSLVVGVLLMYFRPKARLYYWSPHSFRFNLKKQNIVLQTDAITIQNLGRDKATDIEIIADSEPDFYQLAPGLPYETEKLSDGNVVLKVKSLGPKEYFTIQVLSYTKIPNLLNIRSSSGPARNLPFQIQRQFPKWFNYLIATLLILGSGFGLYWLIRATIFISKNIF